MQDQLLLIAVRNYLRSIPAVLKEVAIPENIRVITSQNVMPNLALGLRWIGVQGTSRDNKLREKGRAFAIVVFGVTVWLYDVSDYSDESSVVGTANRMSILELSSIVGESLDSLKNKQTLAGCELPGRLIDAVYARRSGPTSFLPQGMYGTMRDLVSTRTAVVVNYRFQRFNNE